MLVINEARVLGYVADEPEICTRQQGDKIHKAAYFQVTTSERRIENGAGEHKEWHQVVAFGEAAEMVETYLAKGSLVLVNGRLCTDTWRGERATTAIVIQERKGLVLLEGLIMPDTPGMQGERPRSVA